MPRANPWKKFENDSDGLRWAKEEICRNLNIVMTRRGLSQVQMAYLFGTSQSEVSRALRTPTAVKMDVGRLLFYLSRVNPRFRMMIALNTEFPRGRGGL